MFLEEIKPYIKDLEVYQVQKSMPNEVKRKAILSIFDKYIKHAEYPGSAPTSLGCGSCIPNVMNRLFGMLTREQVTTQPIQRDLEDQIKEEESINKTVDVVDVQIKDLRWGELKKYATNQGINTVGKKKVQILKELGV